MSVRCATAVLLTAVIGMLTVASCHSQAARDRLRRSDGRVYVGQAVDVSLVRRQLDSIRYARKQNG